MARFTIKSGVRGRPLVIDSDKLLEQLQRSYYPALQTLKHIRKTTSGIRDPRLLGTSTSAPEWLVTTRVLIEEQLESNTITYNAARYIKGNIEALKRLASRNISSREKGLSDILYQDYLTQINYQLRTSNKSSRKWIEKMKLNIEKLTPKERQQFFLSKSYESPRAFGERRYEKIKAWAKKQTGKRSMSFQEAYSYLLYRRSQDGLKNSNEQDAVFSQG